MFASKQGILQRILGRSGLTTKLENLSADVADLGNIGSDNFLINGAMEFNQRYGSTAVLAGTGGIGGDKYIFDRWWSNGSADVYHQVQRIAVTDLIGFQYAWSSKRINVASGNLGYINQPIEYENVIPLQGKRVTVSYYMKVPISPTNNLRDYINYSTTANEKEPTTTIYDSGLYSCSGMTSWTRRYFSFNVPTNAKSLMVRLAACGSNTVLNAEIQVTGVMLNIGSQPAPFVRAGKTIGGELALCQRYYEKNCDINTAILTQVGASGYSIPWGASSIPSDADYFRVHYKVAKRAVGSPFTWPYSTPANTMRCSLGTSGSDLGALSANLVYVSENGFTIRNDSGGALSLDTSGEGCYSVICGWACDSEI